MQRLLLALLCCSKIWADCVLQSEAKVRLKEELASPLRVLQETARRIAKVSTESGIALVEEEYVQTFKVEMMDVVLQWCKGTKFADICKVRAMFCIVISSPWRKHSAKE